MRRLILCLLLYVVASGLHAANMYTLGCEPFVDNITPIIYNSLKQSQELVTYYKNEDGVQCRLRITNKYLRRIVRATYNSALLNPSWGKSPEEIAIKHLSVIFGESRFNYQAVNYNAWNNSYDRGLEQINDCNWCRADGTSRFKRFCLKHKYNFKDKTLLYDLVFNIKYAAYLNEMLIQCGNRRYHYYGTPKQKKFYNILQKALHGKEDKDRGSNWAVSATS